MPDKPIDNSVEFEFHSDSHAQPMEAEGKDGRLVARIPGEKYITPAIAAFLNEADEFRYEPELDEIKALAGVALRDGKLIVAVGKPYIVASDEVKAEILQHECAHFVMGHYQRQGDRNAEAFNSCCDAAIHHTGVADHQIVEEAVNKMKGWEHFMSATFDRLRSKDGTPIPPMMAESAYELLAVQDKDPKNGPSSSCGTMGWSKSDDSPASRARAMQTAMRVLRDDKDFATQLGGMRGGHGEGHRPVPELKAPSPWIREIITYLVRTAKRTHRDRSYRRENRAFDMLPGQSAAFGRGARFLIDASGSITEEMLTEFLSCVVRTPELSGSDVVVFDTSWSEPIPVTDVLQITKAVRERGGGTHIRAAGIACRAPHLPAVWFTDAETGDGWPPAHTQNEVWCVYGGAANPPRGITIRIPQPS